MTRWDLAYWYSSVLTETPRPGGAGSGGELTTGDGVGPGSAGRGYGPGDAPNVAIFGAIYPGFWEYHVLPKETA